MNLLLCILHPYAKLIIALQNFSVINPFYIWNIVPFGGIISLIKFIF